ncbi:MAG: c-type cytochrome biogenesis protein CcmI [Alphaproteobacteria bacterium]|nr:c-type cytochrome biogenesis protein CcmI [Alphaproteobacteria bacterium]
MTFWIIAALMVGGTAAVLALPLLRNQMRGTDTADYDLEVYRDQLAELERDHDRANITDDEMEAARIEISRRMLAADQRRQKSSAQGALESVTGIRIFAGVLAITLSIGTVLFYLQTGTPGAPDMPLAQRTDLAAAEQADQQIAEQIAELARAAEENPEDAGGWIHLAGAYRSVDMYDDAVAAYRKAIALGPVTVQINGNFAETLVMSAEGTVTAEAFAIFETILASNASDPRARFYLATGDYQAGRTRKALDRWAEMIASSPADAPWMEVVQANLTVAAQDLGLDVAAVMPEPLPASQGADGAPQLTPEQRAEVDAMTPTEREAMIREMVDRLDGKLRDDPMNLEGWERLIRARVSLGDNDAAQDALGRALEAFAQAPVPKKRLVDLASELQLDMPGNSVDAPDIGDMVARLEAKMQSDPDNLEGWMMLARSYTVLGETGKARKAMDNAVRLAPDNPDVLVLQARAVRDENGGKENDETIALLRRVLELAPNNPDALWFLGNAEAETGDEAKARELLERLLAQIPEDSPDRDFVIKRLDQLGG